MFPGTSGFSRANLQNKTRNKMFQFQRALNSIRLSALPSTPYPSKIKAPLETKINKIDALYLPFIGCSHKVNNIKTEKQISILLLRIPNWDCQSQIKSWTRISKVYASTDSEHKLYKKRTQNWLPMGIDTESPYWISAVITITPYSANNRETSKVLYTHTQSLGIKLATFHFPETVQAFSNPTYITQSSINPQ